MKNTFALHRLYKNISPLYGLVLNFYVYIYTIMFN